ncbi:MAG: peptidase [Ignavibacteria bacterium RIFOXYC2_FULL_35_16]|nr:MAG: peptidase [Ignavibacteria bacterium GWA2_36_19]OGU59895.1 MAG: peptidase [Ignavibacteria bacterium GWF2_35_20]OGU78071.1 MAG: peptidase [Ignavibacteria bacterium RIFOXYA2_FULL_35_9]OGU85401.1 MAG: peptidase [Ignavibacteria bacterium RIFOXYA12_FULL_35_25]OGU89286.1 MAG: peptidase [Ignavibacteria bacterium RIFOXYC12_FULL_35_11]OGU93428.1 MAG: peptidase [Ignavibacteria bacterium RIFOXYB12_FULL_35_14]OGV00211.1 MAG: peptidase [Ignavibacteria bacterium RIFOXYC2_FULL_35_16]OGV28634.1 MAG: 
MDHFKKTILPNGIKILTETLPESKSFSLGFWFEVGSRDEDLKHNGVTHFIEHMFFKGTKKRSAKKIVTEIESCGGYLNAFTSKEHTCYYGRGLVDHFSVTFDVISDMIQNSIFKQSEIKKEAGVIVDELRDVDDNPEELIFDKFEEILFSGNSLSYPILGTEKNIRKFTHNDFVSYINQKYAYDRMLIASSGGIKHEEVVRLAEKYFNKNFIKSRINRKLISNHKVKTNTANIDKEIQQVHAIIGSSTYGYQSKKRVHVSLLSQILGEGSSSRLFQSLRERNGIAYQVHSFLNSFLDTSVFGIYFSTNEKMISKALRLVEMELKKLRANKISEKELNKAKESLKGNIILSMESTSNRMIRMAQSELYYNKYKTLEETISEINSVSVKNISDITDELLNPKTLNKLFVKSKKLLIN